MGMSPNHSLYELALENKVFLSTIVLWLAIRTERLQDLLQHWQLSDYLQINNVASVGGTADTEYYYLKCV